MSAFDTAWGVLKAHSNMQTTLPAEHFDDRGEINQTQRRSTIHPAVASMIARYKNEADEAAWNEPNPFDAIFGDEDKGEFAPRHTAENVLGNRDPTLNPSMGAADSINYNRPTQGGTRFDDTQIGRIRPHFEGYGGYTADEVGVITHRDSMPPIGQRRKRDAYGDLQPENMWTTPQGTETNTALGPRGTVNQFIDPQMQSEIGPQMALPMDSASVQARAM